MLLLPLFSITLVGSVMGQDAAQKKIRLIKYPIASAPDAVGEVETNEDQKVLDDFYQSKVLEDEYQAAVTNNPDIWNRLIADRMVDSDERFGIAKVLTKTQFVNNFRTGEHHHTTLQHDHVRLIAFGDTVVLVGRSYSVLHYGGKLSKGPRLATEAWIKLDGRWQMVVHTISDLEDGLESREKP
jgi:hypothetical protein